jgi:hypothetical protein
MPTSSSRSRARYHLADIILSHVTIAIIIDLVAAKLDSVDASDSPSVTSLSSSRSRARFHDSRIVR